MYLQCFINNAQAYFNVQITKNLFEIFDFEKAILTEQAQQYRPKNKGRAVVVVKRAWNNVNKELFNEA